MKTRLASLLLALMLLTLMTFPLTAGASNFYIFPNSHRKHLTYEEVWAWQYDALGYAFNELFARYGRPFIPGSKYDIYFHCQLWYQEDPNYPGDGPVLSNLEWDNYVLIKKVREEMRAMGTTNPTGKALPPAFDDRISSPLSGFSETYFKPKQSLKVYDGPGQHYRRGANGKAVASTNGAVYVAGWESGWLMVMYQLSKGGVRVGFANPSDFTDIINAPALTFDYLSTKTLAHASLVEDPMLTMQPIAQLPAGTPVYWLTHMFTRNQVWDYVEVSVNGQLCRGFLPYGTLELVFTEEALIAR